VTPREWFEQRHPALPPASVDAVCTGAVAALAGYAFEATREGDELRVRRGEWERRFEPRVGLFDTVEQLVATARSSYRQHLAAKARRARRTGGSPLVIDSKPTRAQLLRVVAELQSLIGEASAAHGNDRDPDGFEKGQAALRKAFGLCVAARRFDPP